MAAKIEIQRRLDIILSELPDAKQFNLDIYSETLTGVTLKHVVDSMYCTQDIPQFDGSYKPSQYAAVLERMSNFDLKFLPSEPWPETWYEWKTREPFENLPISHTF